MELDNWLVVESFFQEKGIVKQHIDSYDELIFERMQDIITMIGPVKHENWNLKFTNFAINRPTNTEANGKVSKLYPHEARLRNFTYASSMFIDVSVSKDGTTEIFKKCFIGKIPMILGSAYCNLNDLSNNNNECKNDPGGYFIVSGSEKVLIGQEKMNNNQVYTFSRKQPHKFCWEAEIRSVAELDYKATSTMKLGITSPNNDFKQFFKCTLPFLKQEIPALLIFKLLGKNTPFDFIELGHMDDILEPSIEEYNDMENDNVFEYVSKK